MERLLGICGAGALGSGTRYIVGRWAGQRVGTSFPFGTLIVNIVGCFLIALLLRSAAVVTSFPPNLRIALATGFLGGLTTYSSFNYETTELLARGARGAAFVNFAVTTTGCFVAGLLGIALARRLFGA